MKLSLSDLLAILRLFGIATDSNVPCDISRSRFTHPSPTNTLYDFRFGRSDYAVLIDETAADDASYIHEQIAATLPGRVGRLVETPLSELTTFGLPYKGKDVYLFALGSDKQRLDAYLAANFVDISRSSWQKHVKAGRVTVNGKAETSPKRLLSSRDTVETSLPEAPDHSQRDMNIVYIDDDVIVVDKPAGILTHRKNEVDEEFTVADFFARHMTDDPTGARPGVVHRLDRDTSGIVIGARHERAFDHLKKQFADRLVEKTYIAITKGSPKDSRANIDLPIARSHSRPGSFMVSQKGKPAQTYYEVAAASNGLSRITLRPTTGRTHQLRVHMAHIGAPILGDRLYGSSKADRLYLHAHQLTLTLPSGKEATFTSPVPNEFDDMLTETKID